VLLFIEIVSHSRDSGHTSRHKLTTPPWTAVTSPNCLYLHHLELRKVYTNIVHVYARGRKIPLKKQQSPPMFAKESILSGFLAATAATLGKIAFSKDSFIVPFVTIVFGADLRPEYCSLVLCCVFVYVFSCFHKCNSFFFACIVD
jgi:hypothetical protein